MQRVGDEDWKRHAQRQIGIAQIDFVDAVRDKTFERWTAERQAISARNVNEGEQRRQEILNETRAEVESILGEASRRSSQTRGDVDAEIIRRYAEAIQVTGDFFTFVRTLEAYETAIKSDTRMILTTDNDFFRMLQSIAPGPAAASQNEASTVPEQ